MYVLIVYVCIVCMACMCMYMSVFKFRFCYIHIHTIHAHTDICILVFTYAPYVCVHMFTSNMGNITCQLQYIHICTGRITDAGVQVTYDRCTCAADILLRSNRNYKQRHFK